MYFVLPSVILWIAINALAFAIDSSRGRIAEKEASRRIGMIARGEEVPAKSGSDELQPEELKLLPSGARALVRLQESLADGPSSILGGMPVQGILSLVISFAIQLVFVATLSDGLGRLFLHKSIRP
ncbi:hypothetical protein [Botrimarina mediterranea]|uniref:hypothetical protein n=1 Tax=Botrimarina mediterranea TaxID=2528022 RepID=UPI00119FCF26|nr:hypothetical protein [Botrimarina mediterranea]